MKEKKVENPIPKPLRKILEGFGIDSNDLFLRVKTEVEKIEQEKELNDL